MSPTTDQLVELIHSLLDNAESLMSDAQLLHDNGRYARCYALAALAGEELGKIGFCLDSLLGAPTLTAKEFRRLWQSHSEKLSSLTAYRTEFIEEPVSASLEALREQFGSIADRKMQAIYVDANECEVVTPESITSDEALDLLKGVDAAIQHAGKFLRPLTMEIVAVTKTGPTGDRRYCERSTLASRTRPDSRPRLERIARRRRAATPDTHPVFALVVGRQGCVLSPPRRQLLTRWWAWRGGDGLLRAVR